MTRVVKPDELDRPDESLREQMRKLELSPQATGSAAATTATKGTTPTVSTYNVVVIATLPCVVGIQFAPFPPLVVKIVVTDHVLCSWPHSHIETCAEPYSLPPPDVGTKLFSAAGPQYHILIIPVLPCSEVKGK